MDWRYRAACRDEDPELHFPVGSSGPALLQIAEAKTVCRRCPSLSACLSYALESGQDFGVWGGMSEDERRALKRRQARTRVRTAAVEAPSAPPLAIAGDSVMHDPTARWHAPADTGRPACATSVPRPMRRPMSEVPAERRCRQRACRKRWDAFADEAVSRG